MTLEEIRNFLKVVDVGSTTKAAEELYISRQGLRNSITRLENELGAPLLERTKAGLEPTDFGRFFAEEAREMERWLQDLGSARERFEIKTDRTIDLVYSSRSDSLQAMIRRICDSFAAAYRRCRVNVVLDEERFHSGEEVFREYDVFVRADMDAPYCEKIYLPPREYILCVGEKHPLFNEPVLSVENIRNEKFVTGYSTTPMYEWIKSIGVPEDNIYFDKFNSEVKRALIASGEVIGLVSSENRGNFTGLFGSQIRMIPLYPPLVISEVMLIPRESIEKKDIVRSFYEFCLNYIDAEKYKNHHHV